LRQQELPTERWEEVLQIIDKSGREPREKTEEKLGKLAGPVFSIFDQGGRSGKLDRLVDGLGARSLAGFVDIDVKIVRGLAYYTGTVFEVFDRAGKLRAIAGGGRYDNLIFQLSDGAVAMPALGFAMGDVVLGELLRDRAASREKLEIAAKEQNKIDIYVVIAKDQRRSDALEQVQALRDRGYRVDYPLANEKVAKQFQTAEHSGARIALLYGDEWPQIKLKNLATREEALIPNEALLDSVQKFFKVSGSA
jgi:histidyl-tRNA synthetase